MWERPAWRSVAACAAAVSCRAAAVRDHVRGGLRHEPLPERPLVGVAVALAGGCVVGEWLDPSPVAAWLMAVAALLAWAAVGRWPELTPWPWPATRLGQWLLLVAIAAGGAAWCTLRSRYFAAADLAWGLDAAPRPVAVEGVVVESPRRLTGGGRAAAPDRPGARPGDAVFGRASSECVIALRAVRHGAGWRTAAGRATVVIDGEPPPLAVGTRVRVWGRGLRPPPPQNPGEFDFRGRARGLRCLSLIRVEAAGCIDAVSAPDAWRPGAAIERLRAAGVAVLARHLSPERAPLAAALLLGARESLPRDESLDFLVTGTIHILSISGLHVGFLAAALFFLLRLLALPRGWALVAVAVATGGYMLVVRAETPVVRATLLVWVTCLGAAIGRRSPGVNALALAALLVMLWHPPELFRTGSQLSFLSTGVLVAAAAALPRRRGTDDPIERLIDRGRPPWLRRLRRIAARGGGAALEGAVGGAAVWAATAPIVAARFHLVSPIGLVLNPLVAPLVALAMAWGFLCLATAVFSATLAAVCGRACDATLVAIGVVVKACAAVPGGFVWVAGPPAWWVAGWYLGFGGLLVMLPAERLVRPRTWVAAAAAWLVLGVAVESARGLMCPRPPCLRAVVAAVGHGCGILVRSPSGRCLLYDAGRLGAAAAARRAVEAVLWEEGVRRLDAIIVSHADSDHFNAVPDLLERFAVGEILVPGQLIADPSWEVGELRRRAARAGVPLRSLRAGDSFALDPLCRVRVLHPPEPGDGDGAPDNETSLVVAVESAGRRLLLTGDIEGPAVERLLATAPERCDVLVAPHHGSRTSLPPDLARATGPRWVIVSGPGGGSWREVRAAYAAAMPQGREERVVKTGADADTPGGAVAVTMDAGGIRVSQFAAGRWRLLPDAGGAAAAADSGSAAGAGVTPSRPTARPQRRSAA